MRKLSMDELNRVNTDEFKAIDKTPIVIILDNIRSMNNIGSVFRTADAFKLEGIYLCGISATPPHREIQKTALGSTESVDWKYFDTTIEAIGYHRKKYVASNIFAVEQTTNSISLEKFIPNKNNPLALIFGNEVNGVSNDALAQCDGSIEIPQFGTKHSLNVSVTTGIVIWDLLNKYNTL